MQRFQSSSMALNNMFHFVFHCVPTLQIYFRAVYQSKYHGNKHDEDWFKENKKMKLTIIHYSSQQSIRLNPIHFKNCTNPYSIELNWINPSLSWRYYYDFACTSGGTALSQQLRRRRQRRALSWRRSIHVPLLIDYYCWLHSCWHWGEW